MEASSTNLVLTEMVSPFGDSAAGEMPRPDDQLFQQHSATTASNVAGGNWLQLDGLRFQATLDESSTGQGGM